MNKNDRYKLILNGLRDNMGRVQSELNFASPFQLLVAVMLSAQCTDKRVNMVTPDLFDRYPTAHELASAEFDDVFEIIRSVTYPRSKAEHLIAAAQKIEKDFAGNVPFETEELMSLPGVGRKTANVVGAIIFEKPVIAVDTHVFRVARRTGLSNGKNVEAVEKDLTDHIPPESRPDAHHYLLLHGRYVCTARSPRCTECCIRDYCKQYKSANSEY